MRPRPEPTTHCSPRLIWVTMPPKKPHPLAARIKRVMQADEEVGKIAQATPFLMGA